MDTQSFNYEEFLKKRHSLFNTTRTLIEKVVRKVTSSKIDSLNRLIVGETNEVYDILMDDGKEFILRIFHGKQNRFINEKWAMEEVSKRGVPVPKIVLIYQEDIAAEHYIFCLLKKIQGTPLSQLPEYEADTTLTKNIIIQAGTLLGRIHKVTPEGFGELLNGGKGEHKTYEDWISRIISKKSRYEEAGSKYNFGSKIINLAVNILEKNIDIFKDEVPVLCHSDFTPKHLIIKSGKINGIIDFGNCQGGSPVHDFSWWHFWQQNPQELVWLKEGYENKHIFENEFEEKYHLIKILIALELLEWNDNVEHLGGIELSRINLKEDVNFFHEK